MNKNKNTSICMWISMDLINTIGNRLNIKNTSDIIRKSLGTCQTETSFGDIQNIVKDNIVKYSFEDPNSKLLKITFRLDENQANYVKDFVSKTGVNQSDVIKTILIVALLVKTDMSSYNTLIKKVKENSKKKKIALSKTQ